MGARQWTRQAEESAEFFKEQKRGREDLTTALAIVSAIAWRASAVESIGSEKTHRLTTTMIQAVNMTSDAERGNISMILTLRCLFQSLRATTTVCFLFCASHQTTVSAARHHGACFIGCGADREMDLGCCWFWK